MVSQMDALDTTAFRARTTAPDLSLTPTALPPSTTISWTCDFSSTLPPSFSIPLTCEQRPDVCCDFFVKLSWTKMSMSDNDREGYYTCTYDYGERDRNKALYEGKPVVSPWPQ